MRCFFGTSICAAIGIACYPAFAADSPRQTLKSLVDESVTALPALQDYTFGPLKDGRSLRFLFQFKDTAEGPFTERYKDAFCVTFDRSAAAEAFYVTDASLECRARGICHRIPEYADALRGKNFGDMKLIEEMLPGDTEHLENWQMNETYARALLDGYTSFVLAVQVHEIGHAVLGHVGKPLGAREEAEADGFAAAVLQMGQFALNGGVALLLTSVVGERNFITDGSHPPSACRVEAYLRGLDDWYGIHSDVVERPTNLPPRATTFLYGSGFKFDDLPADFLPAMESCQSYVNAFHTGVQRALELVDENTPLNGSEVSGETCESYDLKE